MLYKTFHFSFSLILLISLFITAPIHGQYWNTKYDNNVSSAIIDMTVLPNENIACIINGPYLNPEVSRILKIIKPDGTTLGDINLDLLFNNVYCILHFDNSIYIGGDSKEQFQSKSKLAQFDINGTFQWSREYSEGHISTIADFDSGLMLGGKSKDGSSIMKVTMNGEIIWTKTNEDLSDGQAGKILVDDQRLFVIYTGDGPGVSFDGIIVTEVNFDSGDIIWQKEHDLGYMPSPFLSDFDTPIGAALQGDDIVIAAAGIYSGNSSILLRITKEGTNIRSKNLYSSFGMIPFDIDITEIGDILIAGSYSNENTSASIEKRDQYGNLLWRQYLEDGSLFNIKLGNDFLIASGCAPNYLINSDFHPYIAKLSLDGEQFNSGAEIEVKLDDEGMCNASNAIDISDFDLSLIIDDEMYNVNLDGKYIINKPPGIYNVSFDLPATYSLCQSEYQITINEDEITQQSLILNKVETAFLEIGLTKTELLRDQLQTLYLDYSNTGNITGENTEITLTKDERINIIESSTPFEINDNGQMVFALGDIAEKESEKIEIRIGVDSNLLESTYLDMRATITADNMQELDTESQVEVVSNCNNNVVQYKLINNNNTEILELDYIHILEGYTANKGNVSISPNSDTTLSYTSNGQAVTLKLLHNEQIIKSITKEGCGRFDNNLYTVNVSPQMYYLEKDRHTDLVSYKVVSNKSRKRILQDNLGVGTDHILQPYTSSIGYNLSYTNYSDTIITNLNATINLLHQRRLENINYRASSHNYEANLTENQLIISVADTIFPNEEFLLRLTVPLEEYDGNDEFLNSTVDWSIGNSPIDKPDIAYNEVSDFFELEYDNLSPFNTISNGNIFGKSGVSDFIRCLKVLPDDSKLVVINRNENNGPGSFDVIKVDESDVVIWKKTFPFKNGSGGIGDLEILNNGNIMLVGTYRDQYTYNTNIESYSYYKVISEDGAEIVEKFWKQGSAGKNESELTEVQQLDDGNIALFGNREKEWGTYFFRLIIDENLNEQSMEDIYLPSGSHLHPITRTEKYEDYIVHSYLDIDYPGVNIPSSFVIYFDDGTYYTSNTIEYKTPLGKSFRGNQYVYQDGYASISGTIDINSSPTEAEYREVIIEYNYAGGIRNVIEVMPDSYDFNIKQIAPKGDNYLVVGDWKIDSLSNADILLMEVDKEGLILWMDGRDMGSREYAAGNIVSTQNKDYCAFQTQSLDLMNNLQGGYIYHETEPLDTENDIEIKSVTKVYPNPTNDRLYIDKTERIKYYSIITAQGAKVGGANLQSNSIDVSSLPSGQYFLAITLSDNTIQFIKFVKI